ncbi:hypothetical protein [Virgibacillus pantothenticus]|uniref:hypothetical protein n=1 Tax=Virgibacillus pantothenticus TaxID=1473 RepID=UPI002814C97B|nr:hypothetical protein [Virgibacillus pantothenticus]MEB5456445.1 hypothetical protein [Virgibacillus pantothenticus]MEB5469338.1 hypothetical protein [Virgibacillus pantothenticus]
MAGAGGYEFRTVHAHILVVRWLTLFSWAVYYKVFAPTNKKLLHFMFGQQLLAPLG